ncbi:hypothetical protein [Spirillospora sp. NPDC048824]|uniref:hypothetical protein n=1 Tax=Spirillospora sp. NPDC048824 TaxID=3364526 RepID=UPI0037193C1F
MPGTAPEQLDIQFTTINDVAPDDVERAREAVARALAHTRLPVLYAKVTLNVLRDPAVPRPNLVSVRVDLNGRPVNAYAAATTMPEAVGLAGARLRARVDHMAGYWEARRRPHRRTTTTGGTATVPAARHDESKELHDA